MKRYLLQVTLFLAIVGCVLGIAEGVVRHMPNSYRFKAEWMDANAASVNTLVLGGSHTYYAVMPTLLGDSTFSLAQVTQHPEYDWWLLERYIDRSPSLKTVIMPVDEANVFNPALEEGNEWFRCTYYNIYMGYTKHRYNPKYSFEASNLAAMNMKLGPALQYLVDGKANLDCDSTGWGSNYDTPQEVDTVYMRRNSETTFARQQEGFDIDYNTHYLYKIAQLCHERGIRLILVTTPMWPDYVKMYDKAFYDRMHAIAGKCVQQWGAEYRDYKDHPSIVGTDFRDASHLSRQGAEKFTNILKQDLGL